jgi:type I restriction enzyme S subunit
MSTKWPFVSLAEIVTPIHRSVDVNPDKDYQEIGVYCFGRGIFHKNPRKGLEVGDKRLFEMKEGDLILQNVFAWEGAIAQCSVEDDGLYGSHRYLTYRVDESRCFPSYLVKYLCTPDGLRQIETISPGSAGRNRTLARNRINEIMVPLPPLDEQLHIVARIENVSRKIAVVTELLTESCLEAKSILQSALFEIFVKKAKGWKQAKLSSVVAISDKQVDPTLPEYRALPHISGENMESGTCRLLPYRTAEEDGVRSGNYLFGPDAVLYSKIRPYLRKAIHVHFEGVCSAEVYPIRCINGEMAPQFLKWALIAQPFTDYANKLSGRTRMPKLNRKQLGNFEISYPSIDDQMGIARYLDDLQAKIQIVELIQSRRMDELLALMPSILDKAFKGEL